MEKLKKYSATVVFAVFLPLITLLFVLLPKTDYSENEKRVLSQFPEVTVQSVARGGLGEELETWLADHFPLRDFWVGVNAYAQQIAGMNGVSGVYRGSENYLFAVPDQWDPEHAARNIAILRDYTERTGLPASIIAVPSAGTMLEDLLPAYHEDYHYENLQVLLQANAGHMQVLDPVQVLSVVPNAYYRTDHHLTSAGAYTLYQLYFQDDTEFSCTHTVPGFYGTAYSKSGLWLTPADDLEIWEVPGNYTVTVREGKQETAYDSLYFNRHLDNMDKYPVFLDGNHSVVTVDNADIPDGRRLLILKDSYAHCFATFAASQCQRVCMVDLRYYKGSVDDLIREYGITEILCLYGAENLANSTDIPWLMMH